LWERARKAAQRWFTEPRTQANGRRDEALRQIGRNILDEPIPEKLRRVLHGKRREGEVMPKRWK
jgi:hypothetical protein